MFSLIHSRRRDRHAPFYNDSSSHSPARYIIPEQCIVRQPIAGTGITNLDALRNGDASAVDIFVAAADAADASEDVVASSSSSSAGGGKEEHSGDADDEDDDGMEDLPIDINDPEALRQFTEQYGLDGNDDDDDDDDEFGAEAHGSAEDGDEDGDAEGDEEDVQDDSIMGFFDHQGTCKSSSHAL